MTYADQNLESALSAFCWQMDALQLYASEDEEEEIVSRFIISQILLLPAKLP